MIYTEATKRAMRLCFQVHRDQKDKGGLPYVFHPFHLAEQMPDEDCTIAALLHDVVEDSALTLGDLERLGFSRPVLDALSLLTHDDALPYMEYVQRIKGNAIARTVKLADLCHNSDLTRLNQVDEGALQRVQKYARAIALLEE